MPPSDRLVGQVLFRPRFGAVRPLVTSALRVAVGSVVGRRPERVCPLVDVPQKPNIRPYTLWIPVAPSATFGHVPLRRAFDRLDSWLERGEGYEVTGEKGFDLSVEREGDEIVLTASKPQHTMKFRWSDEHQDPSPVHISMDIPRVVHAAVQKADRLELVLLTPTGSVVDRFSLPPESES